MTQDPQIDFNIVDETSLQEDKEKYIRELKLQELFENAPEELQGVIEEAKKEPIEDLIYAPGKTDEENE